MKNTWKGMGALGLGFWLMGAGCWSSCFVRGTRIVTPQGFRRIEDLVVGDEVYSLDLATRRPVVRRVAEVLRAEAAEILHIAAGELVLAGVTPEHPLYDAELGAYAPAGELQKGTRLVAWLGAADVRELEITEHRSASARGKVEVFNLTIDGPEHNYFAEGLLVHNKDVPTSGNNFEGLPCASNADCAPGGLFCVPTSDGLCGSVEATCEKIECEDGPLRTICGCDGKPHIADNCPSVNDVNIDKRPESCAPPEGMYNCGNGTCALETQYCLEGYLAVECKDLPPSCTGAEASCECLEAAGVASCGCVVSDGGIRVSGCKP